MVTKEVFTKRLILAILIALAIALDLAFQTNVDPAQALFQSPVPPNDDYDSATAIDSLPFTDATDTTGATAAGDDPETCTNNGSVWYAFTPDTDMQIEANTFGSDYDTVLSVYTGVRGTLSQVPEACNDDFQGLQSRVTFSATGGTTYFFLIGFCCGFGSNGGGNLVFSVQEISAPPNDNFANATKITGMPFNDNVDTGGATMEAGEPTASCAEFNDPGGTVWYVFTPPESRLVSASAFSTFFFFDTFIAAYTGDGLDNLSEVGCLSFGGLLTFQVDVGTTYYFQVGGLFGQGGPLQFTFDLTPPPEAFFFFFPSVPSVFDTVQFFDNSFDPGGVGIEMQAWDFGDGTTATGCCPTHQYAADGDYIVQLMVTTFDGRNASTSQEVQVRTHDVAITKFSAPKAASTGQTRKIGVGLNSKQQPEEVVEVQLYKSVPGGFEFVGSLIQTVPARSANRTINFDFSYTFTAADASIGKVTFKAIAFILNANDALPADNEAIAAPTKVNR